MERRRFNRFDVELRIETEKESKESPAGMVKNFSREGLKATFDNFEFPLNSPLELKIQKAGQDSCISVSAEPLWMKPLETKCEVGFKLKRFPADIKAEILEYGYLKWLKENMFNS